AGFGLILSFGYRLFLFNYFISAWVFLYFGMGFSFGVSHSVWAFFSSVGDIGFVVWVSVFILNCFISVWAFFFEVLIRYGLFFFFCFVFFFFFFSFGLCFFFFCLCFGFFFLVFFFFFFFFFFCVGFFLCGSLSVWAFFFLPSVVLVLSFGYRFLFSVFLISVW